MELTERSVGEVFAGNSCLLHSAVRGEYRDYFFKKMDKMSFSKLIETIDRKSVKLSYSERILQTLSILKHRLKGDC